jgi:hypothetical protein
LVHFFVSAKVVIFSLVTIILLFFANLLELEKIIDCASFEEIFGAKWYKKYRLRQFSRKFWRNRDVFGRFSKYRV